MEFEKLMDCTVKNEAEIHDFIVMFNDSMGIPRLQRATSQKEKNKLVANIESHNLCPTVVPYDEHLWNKLCYF